MKKKILFLAHDYWHALDIVKPMIPLLENDELEIQLTDHPQVFFDYTPDLLISCKDPIENDQIPTPVWWDETFSDLFLHRVREGMGAILFHAAVTDLPEDHPILKEAIRGTFVSHPKRCPVTLEPISVHPVLNGVTSFTLPDNDEQYIMNMNTDTQIIAETISEHGRQPGIWAHTLDHGRICCLTPGHTVNNLTCEPFIQIMKNAIEWCLDHERND